MPKHLPTHNAVVSDYYLPDGEAKSLFPLPVDLPVIVHHSNIYLEQLPGNVNPIEMLTQAAQAPAR